MDHLFDQLCLDINVMSKLTSRQRNVQTSPEEILEWIAFVREEQGIVR